MSKSKGSEGAERPPSSLQSGSLSAPAAVFYAGRGRDTHTQASLWSHPAALSPGSRRSRDHRTAALGQPEFELGRRSRRAAVRSIAGSAQPRVTCPGPLRERASRRCGERATPPQARHRPCPASAAQLMRPMTGRVEGNVGEARWVAIRKLAMSAMGQERRASLSVVHVKSNTGVRSHLTRDGKRQARRAPRTRNDP